MGVSGAFGYAAKFGYWRDTETGLYLCTFRYYDPAMGRWLTRDPIGYAGGQNLYAYCGNDPVNGVDPSGLDYVVPRANGFAVINTTDAWGGIIRIMGVGKGADLIKRAFNTIRTTGIGGRWARRLWREKRPVWVHIIDCENGNMSSPAGEIEGNASIVSDDFPDPLGRGNELFIDPFLVYAAPTSKGEQFYPLDVQIAHEMGHAVSGFDDVGNGYMDNVRAAENVYRAERRKQLSAGGRAQVAINRYADRTRYGG